MKLASDLDPDLHCNVQYAGPKTLKKLLFIFILKYPAALKKVTNAKDIFKRCSSGSTI